MSKFNFFDTEGKTTIYAADDDIQQKLRVNSSTFTSKRVGVNISREEIKYIFPYTIPLPAGCVDNCSPPKIIDQSITISLSHLAGSLAIKEHLKRLADSIYAGEFDSIIEGRPATGFNSFEMQAPGPSTPSTP